MPAFSPDDAQIASAMQRWMETARSEVDDIGAWRIDPREKTYRSPWPPIPPFCDKPLPGFENDTTHIHGIIVSRFQRLDPAPILKVFKAVQAWHTDHNAGRIPPQEILVNHLASAQIVLEAVYQTFHDRAVLPAPAQPRVKADDTIVAPSHEVDKGPEYFAKQKAERKRREQEKADQEAKRQKWSAAIAKIVLLNERFKADVPLRDFAGVVADLADKETRKTIIHHVCAIGKAIVAEGFADCLRWQDTRPDQDRFTAQQLYSWGAEGKEKEIGQRLQELADVGGDYLHVQWEMVRGFSLYLNSTPSGGIGPSPTTPKPPGAAVQNAQASKPELSDAAKHFLERIEWHKKLFTIMNGHPLDLSVVNTAILCWRTYQMLAADDDRIVQGGYYGPDRLDKSDLLQAKSVKHLNEWNCKKAIPILKTFARKHGINPDALTMTEGACIVDEIGVALRAALPPAGQSAAIADSGPGQTSEQPRASESRAPAPGAQPHTLEWFISTLKWYEELTAKDTETGRDHAALFGSAEAQSRIETYSDRLRVSRDIASAPGKGRIELLCNELDNNDGLTAANVVKLRTKVCRTKPCTLEEANALSLNEAADVLESANAKKEPAEQPPSADAKYTTHARHSSDFRTVHWYGVDYSFTDAQSRVISALWEAWKNDTPDVGTATLKSRANTTNERLQDMFKSKGKYHPAWRKMIVQGATKGTYRLQAPAT